MFVFLLLLPTWIRQAVCGVHHGAELVVVALSLAQGLAPAAGLVADAPGSPFLPPWQ